MASTRPFLFRLPAVLLLSLLLAILACALLLRWLPQPYSVVAYLQVKSKPSVLVFEEKGQHYSPKEDEFFKQTQLTLLKSQFVLEAALNRHDISQMQVVLKEHEPLLWLENAIRVSFPGEGEILMLAYEGDEEPEEMKKIIDAVIQSYQQEVVVAERIRKIENFDGLRKLQQQLKTELREERDKYYTLEKELQTQPIAPTEKQLNTLNVQLREYRKASSEARADIANKLVESLPANFEFRTESSQPQKIRNGELDMLHEEIAQLQEVYRAASLRFRKQKIEQDSGEQRVRVMQNAFATEKIKPAQRYTIAILGGLATFAVSCIVLALIGSCFRED